MEAAQAEEAASSTVKMNKVNRETKDISPPPLKRRKLESTDSAESTALSEGHLIPEQPPPHPGAPKTMRLFSWNINGIGHFVPPTSARITAFFKPSSGAEAPAPRPDTSLRAFLSHHNWPEILFLQELKVNPDDPRPLSSLLSAINSPPLSPDDRTTPSRTYTLDASLPQDKHNARAFQGKLYGVGTLIRTDFSREQVHRVRDVTWDLEGRVSIVETRRPDSPRSKADDHPAPAQPLALVNVYAVNGTAAPYRCPATGAEMGSRHDRKIAFHAHLRDECLALARRGFAVLVAGDLNVARGEADGHPNLRCWPARHMLNRADFNVRFFGPGDNVRARAYVGKFGGGGGGRGDLGPCMDGVDVFRAMHGMERKYTYYPRTREWGSSCDRVDLIIASRELWESGRVVGTDILDTPLERGPSDHVPLWVEIAMERLGMKEAGETMKSERQGSRIQA